MGLSKFSAKLNYTSEEGCEYSSDFKQNPKTTDANKVLVDLINHVAWMGAVGGFADEAREAFEQGFKQGIERRAHLDGLREGASQ